MPAEALPLELPRDAVEVHGPIEHEEVVPGVLFRPLDALHHEAKSGKEPFDQFFSLEVPLLQELDGGCGEEGPRCELVGRLHPCHVPRSTALVELPEVEKVGVGLVLR